MIFFVHVYHTVISKFGIEAKDHAEAMDKADVQLQEAIERLEFDAFPTLEQDKAVCASAINLPIHLATGSADEVTGYMVDELGDDEYERTVEYEADGTVFGVRKPYRLTSAERDTILAALRCYQQTLDKGGVSPELLEIANDSGQMLDSEAIDGLCEGINT